MVEMVGCPDCLGDGMDTCHNPDHGFISMLSFHDVGRLGCPVCGNNEKHKVKSGGPCESRNGAGMLPLDQAQKFCADMKYDFEDVMDHVSLTLSNTEE